MQIACGGFDTVLPIGCCYMLLPLFSFHHFYTWLVYLFVCKLAHCMMPLFHPRSNTTNLLCVLPGWSKKIGIMNWRPTECLNVLRWQTANFILSFPNGEYLQVLPGHVTHMSFNSAIPSGFDGPVPCKYFSCQLKCPTLWSVGLIYTMCRGLFTAVLMDVCLDGTMALVSKSMLIH